MLESLRDVIRSRTLADEATTITRLGAATGLGASQRTGISDHAASLVRFVRGAAQPGLMESFLAEYGLSTKEGVALMCLAEALLRVPDAGTIDDLIQDKIVPNDWGAHVGDSGSLMVNASTWALMLTGRVLEDEVESGVVGTLHGMVRRLGEPVIRLAVGRAMREMGTQFVLGRDIREAIGRGHGMAAKGYAYSYDMLGEAARTDADAMRYHGAYAQAIAVLSERRHTGELHAASGISVKLSALHPRYEYGQREHTIPTLVGRVRQLAVMAKNAGIGFNVDAEEADRLELSLDVVEAVLNDPALAGWDGFGVVVQAYGPRAMPVIEWLYAFAEQLDRRIMVRLVKGAYWDTEIKRGQTLGLDGFPVFTRKAHTDISYLACARMLLDRRDRIYPQFATHNAHTAAAVLKLAGGDHGGFEFQRLHGMGEALHEALRQETGIRCRIYAPVGAHRDLLAYLVRRLLENGANSSFVHQIIDERVSPETTAQDPHDLAGDLPVENSRIARPSAIYGPGRRNARGWDLTDPLGLAKIDAARARFARPYQWKAGAGSGTPRPIVNPADLSDTVGQVFDAAPNEINEALDLAFGAASGWAAMPVAERAEILYRIADLYEFHAAEFFALATREAGKTLADGIAEVREAVDFLRYYAAEAEAAERESGARGVIVCISPWNFPLAIFTGQIAAALATGNAVIAKPAEQTPLIAARAVALMHEAGIPGGVLHLLPGDGPSVGGPLTADPRIGGVCFTGSTEVAKRIDWQLAETAPGAMLIAETGGLNAMIVDSTALPEQAVRDILASTFQSAGQRCSSLRVLYLQRDVEERVLEMLFGAMDLLAIGDPWDLATDIGPVIDTEAHGSIETYCGEMERAGRLLKRLPAPSDGLFCAPTVVRVSGIDEIEREVFGPVLHVARFDAEKIGDVVGSVNAKGYGLTFGIHTRIDRRVQDVVDTAKVGNLYVNRNQIGAIVGSQPFGGEGLSGTGPKAGGPHYLGRFRRGSAGLSSKLGPLDIGAERAAAAIFELKDTAEWAVRKDRVSTLRDALRGRAGPAMSAAAALDIGPVDLPGPTGESNRLSLNPKGTVLCLGPDAEAALDQAVQALRCGNRVLAIAPGASEMLSVLLSADLPIAALDGRLDPEVITALDLDALAYVGGDPAVRRALSRRDGPIVPLIDERIAPQAYANERAICIDTTAAGGNTTLLALAH